MATPEYPTPAFPDTRVRVATVTLNSASGAWTNTGLVSAPGDTGLRVIVSGGPVLIGAGIPITSPGPWWAYPEGAYPSGSGFPPSGGYPQTTLYDPSRVAIRYDTGFGLARCKNIPIVSVGLGFQPVGAGAPPTDGSFDAALYPARGKWFGPDVIPSVPSLLWAIFNDNDFSDNVGSFTLYLSLTGNPSEL